MSTDDELQKAAQKLNVGGYRRHVFLCLGPSCCSESDGQKAWDALKHELKEAGLGDVCQRTKAGCLRICCEGPTMVVYPEGTWYRNMTADRMARFVHEHLAAHRPVDEWIFARNPIAAEPRLPS